MSISSARVSDEEAVDLTAASEFGDEFESDVEQVAANATHYSSEEVQRIRDLIEETNQTVAKFRKLVVAQNDGSVEYTPETPSDVNALTDMPEEYDGLTVPVNLARDLSAQPLPRAGVLWAALQAKKPNGEDDTVRLPAPGKAELQARQRDEEIGRPRFPPLVDGHPTHLNEDETLPDFFTLRLSLRYLQFRHQSGSAYNDDIKNEYTLLLEGLSEVAVQYNAMHRSTQPHREMTERLEDTREELIAERLKSQSQIEEIGQLRAELAAQNEAGENLKAEFDTFREEQARLSEETAKEFAVFEEEKKELADTTALLVAETSILRKALSDACDTIADDMSSRLITEALVQDLEDRLATRSVGARKLEQYAS